ncbi:TonB-dependent receptor [Asticcacaulis sp.]|uniref:TonB-dependent receptor n=1 Tax=Asticcacaulis sp. TaxID=1872648 RepID=UPI00261AAF1F|nr:TonB-dependent receptor [Asticcacaulis sp.]
MTPVSNRKYRSSVSLAAIALAAALVCAAPAYAQEPKYKLDIPSESAAKALNDFAQQAGLQILFPYEAADVGRVPAIKGEYTREEALKLILAGTNLEVARQDEKTISLRVVKSPLAGAGDEAVEVIVTGTHIRGGNPTSPVHTVTRKDIEQSGYSQIGDIMRSLPENFSGGQNPGVIAAATTNVNNSNFSSASTVNLRGLGSDATLVLLNGHRMAADGHFQASDISGVPLGVVQRVEVVTDGASAIYGSDAVAGVTNIVLRRNYSGTEISGRVGVTAEGGGSEQTWSLLSGVNSSNSYLFASFEVSRQGEVTAADREVTASAPPTYSLMPYMKRASAFIGAGHTFNDYLSVTFDGLVNERKTHYTVQYSSTSPESVIAFATPSYSTALTFDARLPRDWKLHLTGVASGSRNSNHIRYPAYGITLNNITKNTLRSLELTADGVAFTLPSGPVKVAVGGGRREEAFVRGYAGTSGYQDRSRTVDYLYGEAHAPLVARSDTRTGLHALELNLSARVEDYSDFGQSRNPRVGLRYVPVEGVIVRSTWGKSFKAPTFLQMYNAKSLVLRDAAFVGGPATGTILMTQGGNPDLKPERSESVTFGVEYQPAQIDSLTLGTTWFKIDYTDRVVVPISNITAILSDPIYAPFVKYNPTVAEQNAAMAEADLFYNFASGPYDPAGVIAFIRSANTNAAAQTVSGVDVSYRQGFDWAEGRLNLFANGSWVKLEQQTISTVPSQELSGTIFNVPDFKARGGLSWQRGGLTVNAIANYVSVSRDTGVVPEYRIASWTTVDANVGYVFERGQALTSGLKISLAASNLFDKAPPYARSPGLVGQGITFDSTNASAMGRQISLTVTKAW